MLLALFQVKRDPQAFCVLASPTLEEARMWHARSRAQKSFSPNIIREEEGKAEGISQRIRLIHADVG